MKTAENIPSNKLHFSKPVKKWTLILTMLFVSNFFAETVAAATTINTQLQDAQGPKPRYKAKRTSLRRIFRVKVLKRNDKIRTKHDTENKKLLGKKNSNTPKAHNKRTSKYRLLN